MSAPALSVVNNAIGVELARTQFAYSERDAMLYALGIGAPADALAPDELKFVYEGSADFQVLPTFALTFARDLIELLPNGELAGIRYDPMMLVQGEVQLELPAPLPRAATVETSYTIAEILDKGSGMLLVLGIESRDLGGKLLASSRSSVFIRGLGGFGGERGTRRGFELPSRPADEVCQEETSARQAMLYRLSGDLNPLHIDPGNGGAWRLSQADPAWALHAGFRCPRAHQAMLRQ